MVSPIQWQCTYTLPSEQNGKHTITTHGQLNRYQYMLQKKAQAAASPLGIALPCSRSLMLQYLYTDLILVGLSLPNSAFIGRIAKMTIAKMVTPRYIHVNIARSHTKLGLVKKSFPYF